MTSYLNRMKKILPEKIWDMRIDLKGNIGVNEVAWDYHTIQKVIPALCNNNSVILGGDVYRILNGKVTTTYDSWYFESEVDSCKVSSSEKKAMEYIEYYYERNGDDFIYSLVIALE